jgi:CelD/BcsL family acetyltransferase involved in cellulose biosynthesis
MMAQFWIVWKNRAIIYKLAYDDKWSAFSPGTLLTFHMIRRVLEQDRPDEINFGRGDDDYKKLWMSARRERWGIEAANPRSVRGASRSLRVAAGMLRDRLLKRNPLAGLASNAAPESR